MGNGEGTFAMTASVKAVEVLDLGTGAVLATSPIPMDGGGAADDEVTLVCLPATGGSAVVARGALLELWALDWWLEFKGSLYGTDTDLEARVGREGPGSRRDV